MNNVNQFEFIKNRLRDGQMGKWFQACDWDNCGVFSPIAVIRETGLNKELDRNSVITGNTVELSCFGRKIKIVYSPDADFDYLSSEGSKNDGTLVFQFLCLENLLLKLLSGASYDILKAEQVEPMKCDVEYVVGDMFAAGLNIGERLNGYFYGCIIPVKCILKPKNI